MKGRIKNIYKKIIKYPVTVWMIVSLLVLSSIYVTFAAYNGTAIVKRVVSTQASSSSSFSSNYMEVYSSNIAVKNLRTTNEGNFICTVTVCNYDQLDPTSPARALINYSFKAELVKYNDTTGEYEPVTTVQKENNVAKTFYVQKIMDDNQTIDSDAQHSLNSEGSFSYTYPSEALEGGNTLRDTYNLCFDEAEVAKDVPDLFIRVSAIPTEESRTQNGSGVSNLASVISISQGRTVETGWHGSLQETSITDYDGYNLIIEGSGAGTIDILWDSSKFTMNPVFVAQYGGTDGKLSGESDVAGQAGWKKRTLTVDSANGDNRYVVQFYKEVSGTYTGTEFASKYIKCENYIQTTDATPTPTP
ncbi:MAG: hypothetical protein J6M24_05275 [Lachnospiraceae bacterium]|nr:hypothetical protein [Lachnospiraceae bacterium]